MPEPGHLNDLAERKRLLLLEGELHRNLIGAECARLRGRIQNLQYLRKRFSFAEPLLLGGSALTGLLAVRNWRKVIRWAPQAWSVWRLFKGRTKR